MEVPSALSGRECSHKGKSLFEYSCLTWRSFEEFVPQEPINYLNGIL